ncbi:DUF218 domain-containing protein [Biscogniauxia marginata]|nr:DUF218 domain-containing protein [Biscogniauxia marginata]
MEAVVVNASSDITRDGGILYDYHQLHMTLDRNVDAVFCLCSLDTRVAERAAQLFLDGYGDHLIFSGGSGKLTEGRFNKPEARVFADIALQMGVPEQKLIVETLSSNTGENVRFTYALLREKGLLLRSFILVQKPYMERRTYATFKKQWPDPSTGIMVTSPQLTWEEYPNDENPQDLVLNIAVGDLIRIKEYPAKSFQIPQDIPDQVWQAAQRLICAGYDSHPP